MNQPNEKLIQAYIERELCKDNRTRVDYRIFNRKTKSFYENMPGMTLSLTESVVLQINGKSIPALCAKAWKFFLDNDDQAERCLWKAEVRTQDTISFAELTNVWIEILQDKASAERC